MGRVNLPLIAVLLLAAASARAGTLVTPPLLVPDASFSASCNASNSHTKDVEVTIEVINSNGITQDSITTVVPPGATKSWTRDGPGLFGCRISFKGSDKKIMGTLYLVEILNPLPVLQVIEAH